jgi:membrane protease YdiL (CAAX protease family)/tRNA A-37 threonylcarbamoyl transferase component Bud32
MIKPIKIFCLACLAVVFFLLFVWLSAVVTVGIINLAQYTDGAIGTYLAGKGVGQIMRRVLLVFAAIIIVLTLKKAGWRGWKDCGWTLPADGPGCSRWVQFLQGMVIGLFTLGVITVLTLATGLHQLNRDEVGIVSLAGSILLFCFSGLLVALVEETLCRGILFRVFARIWRTWPAAIIISVIFAGAHFIGPENMVFHDDSFAKMVFNISVVTIKNITPPADELVRFINLVLLGIVLCVFVMRTRTIWMGVGAHAVWVAMIKLHSHFTIFNPAAPFCVWLGKRNDFMDSLMATFFFVVLILLVLWNGKKTGFPVKIRGKIWHISHAPGVVMPLETGRLEKFLKAGEDLFSDGNVLKAYPGCRVVGKEGLVFKKYWPKNFLDALRFAFRPLRVKRAFQLADALIDCELPTPPVLAWSAARRLGLLRSEAMIVSEVKNAEPLTDWLKRKTGDSTIRLKVMQAYGNLMAGFHRHGYSNRDLKHENVMCSREKPWLLWVVDLDGVRKQLFITRRRAGKDLFRIGKSLASLGWTNQAEIAAFFEVYNSQVPPRLHFSSFPG